MSKTWVIYENMESVRVSNRRNVRVPNRSNVDQAKVVDLNIMAEDFWIDCLSSRK